MYKGILFCYEKCKKVEKCHKYSENHEKYFAILIVF